MKIIISPAKKMNQREDEIACQDLPRYCEKAKRLAEYIRSLSYEQVKELWKCNDSIARLNYERFQSMDMECRLTPALLSYEGIQYQSMAPGIFEQAHWDYVQAHLRILSGLYGVVKPLDGIVPYRLEMQAKVCMGEGKGLYQYWGDSIYQALMEEEQEKASPVIINLASKEYSKVIEPYLTENTVFITCVFAALDADECGNPKMKVKATEAKMARGEMVRFMAEHQITEAEEMKTFSRLRYQYMPELSNANTYVFLKRDSLSVF